MKAFVTLLFIVFGGIWGLIVGYFIVLRFNPEAAHRLARFFVGQGL